MTVKITQLTGMNVRALRETLTDEEKRRVAVTATTAEFSMDAERAYSLVADAQTRAGAKHGTRGHPYQSLHAVLNKIVKHAQARYDYSEADMAELLAIAHDVATGG